MSHAKPQPDPERLDRAMHALAETRIPTLPESLVASTVETMNSRSRSVEPVPTPPTFSRRTSMARYFQFGSALAAMALLATVAAVLFLQPSQASAWQDVVAQVKAAKSLIYDEVQTNHLQPQFPQERRNYVLGDVQRTDMLQFENTFSILNQKTGEWLVINGSNKTFIRRPAVPEAERTAMKRADTFITQLTKLSSLPSTNGGEEKLGDVVTRKITIQNAQLGGHTGTMTLWYDARTKLPVRIVHEVDNAFPNITRELTNFQWNASIDAKLFTPEVPKDYEEDKRDFNLKK
jgi:outer membrane lipoprotein-sorting protein